MFRCFNLVRMDDNFSSKCVDYIEGCKERACRCFVAEGDTADCGLVRGPEVLSKSSSIYIIYNCGCGSYNTTRRPAGWNPSCKIFLQLYLTLTNQSFHSGSSDCQKNFVTLHGVRIQKANV